MSTAAALAFGLYLLGGYVTREAIGLIEFASKNRVGGLTPLRPVDPGTRALALGLAVVFWPIGAVVIAAQEIAGLLKTERGPT